VNRIILSFVFLFVVETAVIAQTNYSYEQKGEFGFSIGASHYFGDLNTRTGLNKPKPAFGLFFRKQFGDYVGLRVAGRYAQVGYSDEYNKTNAYQRARNLSFNSNIFEFAIQGDFNFYKFVPTDINYGFTPYVTLGVGFFSFDPYTTLDGTKHYLQPIGTEGQQSGYMGRTPYSLMSVCVPFGVGVKYSLNPKVNISFEITHRFTLTDYLDDVSTTYATNYLTTVPNDPERPDCFPTDQAFTPGAPYVPSVAYLLQDRSYETLPGNQLSNVEGRQRGWSKQKDQYVIAEIGISFNIGTYRCPTSN
jgi:hypothetical protein